MDKRAITHPSSRVVFGLVLAGLFLLQSALAGDDPASLQRLNETQQLQLKREQQQYQQQLAPLDPVQQLQLQRLMQQQRDAQRSLQRQQLQNERGLRHEQSTQPPDTSHQRLNEQLQRDRRHQDQQRLQFELDRRTWPYPRR